MTLINKTRLCLTLGASFTLIFFGSFSFNKKNEHEISLKESILKRSFTVEVSCVGELEADKAITISSQLRGDKAKLISLISDGQFVQEGDVLARIDPTPFEEVLKDLEIKYQEQLLNIENLKAFKEREATQIEHENEIAVFEVESAKLELIKVNEGDAPLEIAKLEYAVNKAERKCREISTFLKELEDQSLAKILGPIEIGKVKKQYGEEKEAYDSAKQQHEAYVKHSLPAQVKKAEMQLEKAILKESETRRNGLYRVVKAQMAVSQAEYGLLSLKQKIEEAKKELNETVIKAPTPGIVVLRDEFRNGQRRKPRVGDILLRNQPILDLPNLTSMIVKTKVREIDLHKINIGKKAVIEVQAFPSLFFEGTVSAIGVLAQSDPFYSTSDKYFEVTIRLNKTDANLRPGMTACASIHSEAFENVLTIPAEAVFRLGAQFFCFRPTYSGAEKTMISIKEGNATYAIVNEGLKEGDEVLLNPPETFFEGV